jgi:EAL and modified HD-GYP domain-containing signal transduction protein
MERILVSRQPIFRWNMTELGYELLFRASDEDRASFLDGDQATAQVIANTFLDIGLDEMVGQKLAFINFDRKLLLGNYCECLPRERVVLEVLETVEPDATLLKRLQELRDRGYRIALDDFLCTESSNRLLEVATFIKFEIPRDDWSSLEQSVQAVKKYPVQLIAEKVETREQFQRCRALGFDYFQGYFFCRPQLVEGRRLPVSRMATLRLITKLNNPDVGMKELEQTISQDVSLSYKLLRYINSAMYSLQRTVNSIGHAVTLIGQENVRNWASLIALSNFENKSHVIVVTGAVRARMCEYLANALGKHNPEKFFLSGLLSVLDGVLNQPMEQILPSLPREREIIDGLLYQKGDIGAILRCVLEYEKRNWTMAHSTLGLDENTIREAYRKAVGWSLNTLHSFSLS